MIDHHVVAGPDNLETIIIGQERLKQILLVPVQLVFEIYPRVRFRHTNVVDMDQNPRLQSRQDFKEFGGPIVANLQGGNVELFLKKLESKLTIGELLQIKAEAQHLQLVDTPQADEVYTKEWALNTAAVTKLLID